MTAEARADPVWIEHDGRDCPVDGSVSVIIRFRIGDVSGPHPARRWRWRAWPGLGRVSHDIVAWRRAGQKAE